MVFKKAILVLKKWSWSWPDPSWSWKIGGLGFGLVT